MTRCFLRGLPGQNLERPAQQTCDNERHFNDQGTDTSLGTAKVTLMLNDRHVFSIRPGNKS
jgi:hypothetical protein